MYLEGRFIAMLDVLGLSSRIADKSSLRGTAEQYGKLINQARTTAFDPKPMSGSSKPPTNFEVGEFVFDTLVLVSHPITPHSVGSFIFACTQLLEMFFIEHFPLRGAIAKGDYFTDPESGVFLSNSFKSLNVEGLSQEWTGCTVLPDASSELVEHLLGPREAIQTFSSSALLQYSVPFKGRVEQRWCLNWPYLLSASQCNEGLAYMAPEAEKAMNTRAYIDHIKTLPDDSQALPPQFAPATRMRAMKARSTMRVRFEDHQSNAVQPGCGFTIAVYDPARA
jgi:hypothetical protein